MPLPLPLPLHQFYFTPVFVDVVEGLLEVAQKLLIKRAQQNNIECMIAECEAVRCEQDHCPIVSAYEYIIKVRANGAGTREHYKKQSHEHNRHTY